MSRLLYIAINDQIREWVQSGDFEAAEQAGIVWLKFDSEAPTVSGLPTFTPQDTIL